MAERLVVDASAVIDLLVAAPPATAIRNRIASTELHTPAHFDVEVLSALGRLHRAGHLSARRVGTRLNAMSSAPIERHELPPLLRGAWGRRNNLRLSDALYVELAHQLDAVIITTAASLARASRLAELVGPV